MGYRELEASLLTGPQVLKPNSLLQKKDLGEVDGEGWCPTTPSPQLL